MNRIDRNTPLRLLVLLLALCGCGAAMAQAPAAWQALASGKTGDTVRLNDLEPHTWKYYTAESPIHSLNPIDIRIAYHGNGSGTVNTSTDATPSTTGWTADATTVKVGIDAPESIFVYYKTLDRANPDAGTGRAPYRTIPNPFSVRPTNGSDNTTKWRGFYKWRLASIEGGKLYNAAGTEVATNGTVDAEEEISFELNENSKWINVEFEALWARAWVATSDNNNANNINSQDVGYERNFIVLTTNNDYRYGGNSNRRISNTGYAVTITNRYPDGTAGSTNASIINDITLGADTKFEYTTFNTSNYTLTAAGHNLVIGRGCTGTINTLRGLAPNTNERGAQNYSLRLESSTINNLYLGTPTYYYNGSAYNGRYTFNSTFSVRCTLGCDYDRANNNNEKLQVARNNGNVIYGGERMRFTSSANNLNLTFDWLVKSGTFNPDDLGMGSGGDESIYMGSNQPGENNNTDNYRLRYIGKRRMVVEGGNLSSIAGGMNHQDNNNNPVHTYGSPETPDMVLIRVKGGNIRGAIYGAAAFASSMGGRTIIVTGGTVGGWIAGGCNGTHKGGGLLHGDTYIYVGGDTEMGTDSVGGYSYYGSTSYGFNGALGGNIFGAGCGIRPSNSATDKTSDTYLNGYKTNTVGEAYGSTIVIADNAMIPNNVYGGGNYGFVGTSGGSGKSDIYILGGTVKGKVFGGSNRQKGQKVNILQTGGTVEGGIYGGSNAWGTLAGPVDITIQGGTVGAAGIDPETSEVGHVFGCGYGAETSVTGKVTVFIGDESMTEHLDTPLINGNVYCGGHNAPHTVASGTDAFHLTGVNGKVMGSIFGGGKGETATITGDTHVLLKGHIEVMKNVFGGGHRGNVTGSTHVDITD